MESPPSVAPGAYSSPLLSPASDHLKATESWSPISKDNPSPVESPPVPPKPNSRHPQGWNARDEAPSEDELDNTSVNIPISGKPHRRGMNVSELGRPERFQSPSFASFDGYNSTDERQRQRGVNGGVQRYGTLPRGAAAPAILHRPVASEAGTILDRLTPGYYRLYRKPDAAIESLHPWDPIDKSIAEFYIEHVSPPRKAKNYIAYICAKEHIHPTRVKLYINMMSEEIGSEEMLQVHPNAILRRGQRECGATPENPLLITVEIAPDTSGNGRDRTEAMTRLPLWIDGSRATGRGMVTFGKWVGSTTRRALTKSERNDFETDEWARRK